MKVVYNWLKEFVEAKASAAEVRTRLSLCGIAIDSIDETAAGPVLDAEITSNRPDCLGHYGIAREVAAIYRQPLQSVQPKLKEIAEKAADAARVEIEASDMCGRFTARVMRGVKVQPSPDWLRQRLEAIGQNSINNVVDVTNYVMFELGHPLHAYDLDKLNERRIVVRRSKPGEKLRTLDGAERTLAREMCVIADGARAVGIGGVMGGAETEISFSTRDILIECAYFDPIVVRRTSKALGLRTEASYRFERGADPEMAEVASRRAAELIQQVAGGEILAGAIDIYPRPEPLRKIKFTREELLRVMGADISDRDIEEILGALGFHPVRVDGNRGSSGSLVAEWDCRQPSWRRDVTRGIDLVEEVARHYGYEKFPPRLPPAKQPAHPLPHAEAQERLIERLVALGYQEIVAIPIVDSEARRAVSSGSFGAGCDRQSPGGRCLRNALNGNRQHGEHARMEFESRAARPAALRNRQSVRIAERRSGGIAGAHRRRHRPCPKENDPPSGARILVCRSEGRPRPHRRTCRRFRVAGGRAWLASRRARGENFARARTGTRRRDRLRGPTGSPHRGRVQAAAGHVCCRIAI